MTPNITVFFMSRFWGLIRRQISGGEAEQGRHSSAQGAQGQGQPSPGLIRGGPGNHEDAVDDGADAEAQGAARAAVGDRGQVGFGIELDSLVAGIITGHVTFATVDTHFLVNQSHNLLCVAELTICSNILQCFSNYILDCWNGLLWNEMLFFRKHSSCALFLQFHLVLSYNFFTLFQVRPKTG